MLGLMFRTNPCKESRSVTGLPEIEASQARKNRSTGYLRCIPRTNGREGRRRRGDVEVVSRLLDVGHHFARSAGCARRTEALAAPHPLCDERAGPHPPRKHMKCAKIVRRNIGQLSSAWRPGYLPDLGAHGADLGDARDAGGPQGNFGSVEGDPPAAMRYTEARFTPSRSAH